MKNNVMRDSRGFSLIELIVVVLIIGILSTGAALSFSVLYNADAEKAAKTLCTVFTSARTEAMTYNDDTLTHNTDISAFIEARDNGDYYVGIIKRTKNKDTGTVTSEVLEDQKLANYRVSLFFRSKPTSSDPDPARKELKQDDPTFSRIEYSFKRGTGRINTINTDHPDYKHPEYCDIFIEGSETFRIIISDASGKCSIQQ